MEDRGGTSGSQEKRQMQGRRGRVFSVLFGGRTQQLYEVSRELGPVAGNWVVMEVWQRISGTRH